MGEAGFGKYTIRRVLGRGARGTVYEAFDPERGLEVALKVMNPTAPWPRARQVARFFREAELLGELDHPNIVRVFDRGEIGGRPFFTMELVRGTTLKDCIQLQGPLSLPDLVRVATGVCQALEHLHSRGVVHRDVKPENVMLLADGRVKLMDFGIACRAGAGAEDGSGFHGSPAYMAPEQVVGAPVDGRTDLYALAVTLYEAATGRRAFEGDDVRAILHRVLHEYPPPPPGVPQALQAILLRAMAKNPADRFASARELAEAIRTGKAPAPEPAALPVAPPRAVDVTLRLPQAGPVGAPGPLAPPEEAGGRCPRHPGSRGVAACGRCLRAVCFGCLVELPDRTILCRECAFGPAG